MRSTPHINPTAPIAPTILLPGDPLRAKFIAETYLEDAQQFNAVRNMLGYTGTYRGTPVSVMGSGMGIPSISLYAHELIHEFGCTRLVRVGTCGALQPGVNLYDVVVAQAACSNSAFLELAEVEREGLAPQGTNGKHRHIHATPLLQDPLDRPVAAHDREHRRVLENDGKRQVARLRTEGLTEGTHDLEIVRRPLGEGRPALELDDAYAHARGAGQVGRERTHRAPPRNPHAHAVAHELGDNIGTDATDLLDGLVLSRARAMGDASAGQSKAPL